MHVFHFFKHEHDKSLVPELNNIPNILSSIATGIDTKPLVVTVYFMRKCHWSGGVAIVKKWLNQGDLKAIRGRWKFTNHFPQIQNLPSRFKLIRLMFDLDLLKYPLSQKDTYGWTFNYESFKDHLALLFAHELHHYRRFHLGLHRGEGEQSANKWALNHVTNLGFNVTGSRQEKKKVKKRYFNKFIYNKFDPYKKYRGLTVGTKILIQFDPKGRYTGQIGEVIRPVRSNSKRIVLKTNDGNLWRWPMDWLTIL